MSHFIALNLNRHIEVIEIPGNDSSKSEIYIGPTLIGPGEELTPVTLSFEDVNHNGHPNLVIHVADSQFIFLNQQVKGVWKFVAAPNQQEGVNHMADTPNGLEQQVEKISLVGFAQSEGDEQETNTQEGTRERKVIDVDLYHLEGGAVLLVPNNGTNSLDANTVESEPPTIQAQETPITETPTLRIVANEQQEEEQSQGGRPEPTASTCTKRRVKPSFVLFPLVLLCILAFGVASYLFLLPLTSTATVTLTPKAKSIQKITTFFIANHTKAGQVQGRTLEAISFTRSKTVPATGHAHQDATQAAGVITFYNTDSSPYTIPADTTFTMQDGQTIVTDTTATVQAAILPDVGSAIASAHVIQAGSIGNIAAHNLYTRCCGSEFITATNTTPFSGGQDARSYSFIQRSDIQNAATDLLNNLTPQATAALNKEARQGEQLVTPLCSPRTQESAESGAVTEDVTVSVTQTCISVAYMHDSLQQVATSMLAHSLKLANYQQEGTVQVTVNSSTYANHTAILKVSLSGVWVYHFTQTQLVQLTRQIAGESQERAQATLEKVDGIAGVSIHVQRLDFKDGLPTNPQKISLQFFYIVS